MSKPNIVINLNPNYTDIRWYEGGFTWTFSGPVQGYSYRQKIINLKFDRWWLVYLTNDLRQVLLEERAEIDRLIKLCDITEGMKDVK